MSGFYDNRIYAAGGLGSISGTVSTFTTGLGLDLGEERWYNGVKYVLAYNNGGASITAGYCAGPAMGGANGPYSVTVTTTSNGLFGFGLVCAHNATVPTASYFWGAKVGLLASGLVADAATLTTGLFIRPGADGKVTPYSANSTVGGGTGVFGPIGIVLSGPAAGTVAVRQATVYINFP